MYPEHGTDPQALVRNGTLAVAAAREAAERVAIYDPARGASEERNMQYEAGLRRALEDNAFALVFAPQLELRSGRIAGLECTLRWSRPLSRVTQCWPNGSSQTWSTTLSGTTWRTARSGSAPVPSRAAAS